MRRLEPSIFAVPLAISPTRRTLHTSSRGNEQLHLSPTSPGSSSSSSSGAKASSTSGPLSYINMILASAAIVLAMPPALELYSTFTGTNPSGSKSTSISGKLEPYTHHPLPLANSSYYPDPHTASVHKLLQIALPASASASASASFFSSTPVNDIKQRLRIRSVYIKEPALVIERAYTPLYDTLPGSNAASLKDATKQEKQVLDLIVKRYPDGELGKMLHRTQPNPSLAQIEVRGPVDTWTFNRDGRGSVPDRIVMVVGGTGVTPAYQLLTNVYGRPNHASDGLTESDMRVQVLPKIDVLYATKDLENALLLPQLHAIANSNKDNVNVKVFAERLSNPKRFTPADSASIGQLIPTTSSLNSASLVSWIPFLNQIGSSSHPKLQLTSEHSEVKIPVYQGRITQQHLETACLAQQQETGSKVGRTLVLVSGPDGMVDAIAGPKSRDGQTQGQLKGILNKIGLKHDDVFKL
ncbi:related to CYC2 - cytochrome-c mitochondrial import factor [Melanopsichium pennsylvanicum]|uniref:Related to CYC2 - cytochrome-c mitochondrial import factor n=2 Tax=Melanopsichium pennsylvanicum TaxID=63383 RepID=A0AAJ4XN60_9BASI|nr:related to CYC2-cytochrome-c mitochondrial import factor [Melanopsichium pennsylvanicum 4]SNX84083.1 related to CYC2 - cytochrome-c mitochondrial import factor [Melanopsichium pennsylvanicum]